MKSSPCCDNDFSVRFTGWLNEVNPEIQPGIIDTLWLNITRRCNQTCRHCHVAGSPEENSHMSSRVLGACLDVLRREPRITTVDITGGAPELHPEFDYLVGAVKGLGKKAVVRHNLTITIDGDACTNRSLEYLPGFFAEHGVDILASLPSCDPAVTDAERGPEVFAKSIESLKKLNEAGYGRHPALILKLVTNREGPISVEQRLSLELEYRQILRLYEIEFNELLCITNLPVGRQRTLLDSNGGLPRYLGMLADTATLENLESAVCRNTVSVGFDGKLYDCDFNLALRLSVDDRAPGSVFDFDYEALTRRRINFADHCFGCVAGAGSG